MQRFKDRIRDDIRDNLPWVGGFVACFCAAISGYSYYKFFAWPTAEAKVERIEPRCVYYKDRIWGRGGDTEYLDCNAKEDAARLIADGYAQGISNMKWVVYEAEPGRKTYAIISLWPEEAGALAIGNAVRVRYSPGTPSRVEYAAKPDRQGFVLALVVIVLSGGGYLFLKHR